MHTKLESIYAVAITAVLCMPAEVFAYGEGEDIPMEARAVHLLTNEARNDPAEALAGCGKSCKTEEKCYQDIMPPFYWNDNLYKAAQFHANNLSAIHCMQHDSPCTLLPEAAKSFPQCDGDPSCACKGGKAKCNSSGTDTWTRIGYFGAQGTGENLASVLTPLKSFNLWLFEDSNGSGCKWTTDNGHRQNILLNKGAGIGVGWSSYIVSQDMGNAPAQKPALTSGAYYLDESTIWFKTQYYNTKTAVSKVSVSVAGTCTELQKTRGTNNHGIWGTSSIAAPENCAPFFFESKDEDGNIVRFPTTGNLLYNCKKKSWANDSSSQTCLGTIVTPDPDPVEPDPDPVEPDPDPVEPDPDPVEPDPDPVEPDPVEPDPDPVEPDPDPDPVEPDPDPVEPDPDQGTESSKNSDDPNGKNSAVMNTSDNCSAAPLCPAHAGWLFLIPALAVPLIRRRKN